MIKGKKKIICIIFILFVLIGYIAYSIFYPISAKVTDVRITIFTSSNADSLNNYANCDEQMFNQSKEEIPSDEASDYVNVHISCMAYNHKLSGVTGMESIVTYVPENDPAFISAHGGEWPRTACSLSMLRVPCNIIMCRKGLTDEELLEKIKLVEIDLLYNRNGKAESCKVNGIDKLKKSDVVWVRD